MKDQLFFDLSHQSHSEEFIISSSNIDAARLIDNWSAWSNMGLIIYGPPSSGKTHLLSLWCKKSNAILLKSDDFTVENVLQYKETENCIFGIDDIEQIITDKNKSKALFHLYNIIKERKGSLLLIASKPIASWDCPLADLLSRLKTLSSVSIAPPDEEMLQALLVKFFSDRQLRISADVISYILKRTERSFLAVKILVQCLDKEALSQKRPITIPLVRDILDNMQENC